MRDVWVMPALAAERTHRIGLARGVLVPTLRHPMVNASGTATLAALDLATWSYLSTYVRTVRGLLRGDTVEWNGETAHAGGCPAGQG